MTFPPKTPMIRSIASAQNGISLVLCCLLANVDCLAAYPATAYPATAYPTVVSPAAVQVEISSVQVGIGNQIVLGHWVPVRIELKGEQQGSSIIELTTLDGNGIPHKYQYEVADLAVGSSSSIKLDHGQALEAYVRFGRKSGGLGILLKDSSGQTITSKQISQAELESQSDVQPSVRPVMLEIGNIDLHKGLGLGRLKQKNNEDTIAARIESFGDLPVNAIGYDGIDTVLLVTRGLDDTIEINTQQVLALANWVTSGGKLVISSSESGATLFGQNGPLRRLVKNDVTGTVGLENTGRIESYLRYFSAKRFIRSDNHQ